MQAINEDYDHAVAAALQDIRKKIRMGIENQNKNNDKFECGVIDKNCISRWY